MLAGYHPTQALGATLYALLLAAYPYGGATPSDIYAEALRGPPFYPQASLSNALRVVLEIVLTPKGTPNP